MPNTGITTTQMLAAIAALQDRGEKITKVTVREELGETGSYTTISKFLARWRESQKTVQAIPAAPIPEAVQALFASAWNVACVEAQNEITKECEVMSVKVAEIQKDYAAKSAEDAEAIQVQEVQLVTKDRTIADLTRELTTFAERIGYLTAKNEEVRVALDEAKKAHETAEANVASVEFLIWSGSEAAWWEAGQRGYTKHRAEAGIFTLNDLKKASLADLEKGDTPSLQHVLIVKGGMKPTIEE